jgi:hypothetical protein
MKNNFEFSEYSLKLFFICWLIYNNRINEAAYLAKDLWRIDINLSSTLKDGYKFVYLYFIARDLSSLDNLLLSQYEFSKLRLDNPNVYSKAKEIRDKFNSYFSNSKQNLTKKLNLIYESIENDNASPVELQEAAKKITHLNEHISILYALFISELNPVGNSELLAQAHPLKFS